MQGRRNSIDDIEQDIIGRLEEELMRERKARRFLEQLPPVNYNVFVYMISFFREVLLHSEANRLTPAKLAVVCCNCMVKSESEDNDEREMQRKHSLQLIIPRLRRATACISTAAFHAPRTASSNCKRAWHGDVTR